MSNPKTITTWFLMFETKKGTKTGAKTTSMLQSTCKKNQQKLDWA